MRGVLARSLLGFLQEGTAWQVSSLELTNLNCLVAGKIYLRGNNRLRVNEIGADY